MEQLSLFKKTNNYKEHRKYLNGVFKTKETIESELYQKGIKNIIRVLSFGGGTQSTHLLEDHFKGKVDYDLIIFSDTGAEPQFIHSQVSWWQIRQAEYGNQTPFIITNHNKMIGGLEEMAMRYIFTDYQSLQLPVYCNKKDENGQEVKAGIMPRQCTVDFKILPVNRTARKIIMNKLGLGYKQRMPNDISFIIDIGFSYDEINRITKYQSPDFNYMYFSYPLVEQNLTTQNSINFLMENDMPSKRSRCYFCPFNCDSSGINWMEIIEEEPLSFLKACFIDEKLRKVQATGRKCLRSIPYLHYSRMPLQEAYPSSYKALTKAFKIELQNWIMDWQSQIKTKYFA